MTIITEQRWKCDHCGNVSPVLSWANGPDGGRVPPLGWVTAHGYDYFSYPDDVVMYHFCLEAHRVAWQAERDSEVTA